MLNEQQKETLLKEIKKYRELVINAESFDELQTNLRIVYSLENLNDREMYERLKEIKDGKI